jgi:hypothetical protein
VDALDLLAADDLRRQRHRLTGTPMRDVRQLRTFLTERAIALETGTGALPSLAAAIAGRRLAGSWMASVYASEREVERWFPFDAAPSIARLVDAGLVTRTDDRKPLLVAAT